MVPGNAFPAFCPERHLNEDSSFCLATGAGLGLSVAQPGDRVVGASGAVLASPKGSREGHAVGPRGRRSPTAMSVRIKLLP
ncbi:E2 domain-containing protein [Mesorhizobium calcicola]|uniref:E2 domain-containing protein n=1 Tax=Mesorhizobium calcicola TaxID=1300310 RepID=A0ABW4WAS7_9HYPH